MVQVLIDVTHFAPAVSHDSNRQLGQLSYADGRATPTDGPVKMDNAMLPVFKCLVSGVHIFHPR